MAGYQSCYLQFFLLIIFIGSTPVFTAPYLNEVIEQQQQTQQQIPLDDFFQPSQGLIGPLYRENDHALIPPSRGVCHYQLRYYAEGERIDTKEPCLNCTCNNSMLMCYLKVCPFSKPIGKDCTVEKSPDQCCPVITCPQVPVNLQVMHMTSTTSTYAPISSSTTELVPYTEHGCSIEGQYYPDGAQVPGDHRKPCELCYCIRNHTACIMQECILKVEGCEPVFVDGICCPVRYKCAHDKLVEQITTTTLAPNGTFITTTIQPPSDGDCYHNNEFYNDGELIESENPCKHCYCMNSDVVCAIQECRSPLDEEDENCTPREPPPGQCCPEAYDCPDVPEHTTLKYEPSITEVVPTEISEDKETELEELPEKPLTPETTEKEELITKDMVIDTTVAPVKDVTTKEIELETKPDILTEELKTTAEDFKIDTTLAPVIDKETIIDQTLPSVEEEEESDLDSTFDIPLEEDLEPTLDTTFSPIIEEKEPLAYTTLSPVSVEEKEPLADTTLSPVSVEEKEPSIDTTLAPLDEVEEDVDTTLSPVTAEEKSPSLETTLTPAVEAEEPSIVTTVSPVVEDEEPTIDATPSPEIKDEEIVKEPTLASVIEDEQEPTLDTTPRPLDEEEEPAAETTLSPSTEEEPAIDDTFVLTAEEEEPIVDPTLSPTPEKEEPVVITTLSPETEEQPAKDATIVPGVEEEKPSIDTTLSPKPEKEEPIDYTTLSPETEELGIDVTLVPEDEKEEPSAETTLSPEFEKEEPTVDTTLSPETEKEPSTDATLVPIAEEVEPEETTLTPAVEAEEPSIVTTMSPVVEDEEQTEVFPTIEEKEPVIETTVAPVLEEIELKVTTDFSPKIEEKEPAMETTISSVPVEEEPSIDTTFAPEILEVETPGVPSEEEKDPVEVITSAPVTEVDKVTFEDDIIETTIPSIDEEKEAPEYTEIDITPVTTPVSEEVDDTVTETLETDPFILETRTSGLSPTTKPMIEEFEMTTLKSVDDKIISEEIQPSLDITTVPSELDVTEYEAEKDFPESQTEVTEETKPEIDDYPKETTPEIDEHLAIKPEAPEILTTEPPKDEITSITDETATEKPEIQERTTLLDKVDEQDTTVEVLASTEPSIIPEEETQKPVIEDELETETESPIIDITTDEYEYEIKTTAKPLDIDESKHEVSDKPLVTTTGPEDIPEITTQVELEETPEVYYDIKTQPEQPYSETTEISEGIVSTKAPVSPYKVEDDITTSSVRPQITEESVTTLEPPTEDERNYTEIAPTYEDDTSPELDISPASTDSPTKLEVTPLEEEKVTTTKEMIKDKEDEITITELETEPSVLISEGSCDVNGTIYINGDDVPVLNNCQEKCMCKDSVVTCQFKACPSAPPAFLRCNPVQESDSCCPTFECEEFQTELEPKPSPNCFRNGTQYYDGDYVPSKDICTDCYCLYGEIVCAYIECPKYDEGCRPIEIPKGSCCPSKYECPELEVGDMIMDKEDVATTVLSVETTTPLSEFQTDSTSTTKATELEDIADTTLLSELPETSTAAEEKPSPFEEEQIIKVSTSSPLEEEQETTVSVSLPSEGEEEITTESIPSEKEQITTISTPIEEQTSEEPVVTEKVSITETEVPLTTPKIPVISEIELPSEKETEAPVPTPSEEVTTEGVVVTEKLEEISTIEPKIQEEQTPESVAEDTETTLLPDAELTTIEPAIDETSTDSAIDITESHLTSTVKPPVVVDELTTLKEIDIVTTLKPDTVITDITTKAPTEPELETVLPEDTETTPPSAIPDEATETLELETTSVKDLEVVTTVSEEMEVPSTLKPSPSPVDVTDSSLETTISPLEEDITEKTDEITETPVIVDVVATTKSTITDEQTSPAELLTTESEEVTTKVSFEPDTGISTTPSFTSYDLITTEEAIDIGVDIESKTTEEPYPLTTDESIIPGEGNCLVNGTEYGNGENVPKSSPCQEDCKCKDSVVTCQLAACPAPPPAFFRCEVVEQQTDDCCPSYQCPLVDTDKEPSPKCVRNGTQYYEGDLVPSPDICTDCYCLYEEIVCATLECPPIPQSCIRAEVDPGVCCPTKYECPDIQPEDHTVAITTDKILDTRIGDGIVSQIDHKLDNETFEFTSAPTETTSAEITTPTISNETEVTHTTKTQTILTDKPIDIYTDTLGPTQTTETLPETDSKTDIYRHPTIMTSSPVYDISTGLELDYSTTKPSITTKYENISEHTKDISDLQETITTILSQTDVTTEMSTDLDSTTVSLHMHPYYAKTPKTKLPIQLTTESTIPTSTKLEPEYYTTEHIKTTLHDKITEHDKDISETEEIKTTKLIPTDMTTEVATEVDSTRPSMPMHPHYEKIPKTKLPIQLTTESTIPTSTKFQTDYYTTEQSKTTLREKIIEHDKDITVIEEIETTKLTPTDLTTEIDTEVDSTTLHPYYSKIPKTKLPIPLITKPTTPEPFISDTSTGKITTLSQEEKTKDEYDYQDVQQFIEDYDYTISPKFLVTGIDGTKMFVTKDKTESTTLTAVKEDIETFENITEPTTTTTKEYELPITDEHLITKPHATKSSVTITDFESSTMAIPKVEETTFDAELVTIGFENVTEYINETTIDTSSTITDIPTEKETLPEEKKPLTFKPFEDVETKTDKSVDFEDDKATEIPPEFIFAETTEEPLKFTSLLDLESTTSELVDFGEDLTEIPTKFTSIKTAERPLTSTVSDLTTPLSELEPRTEIPLFIGDDIPEIQTKYPLIRERDETLASTSLYDLESTTILADITDEITLIPKEFVSVQEKEEPLASTPLSDLELKTGKPADISSKITLITTEKGEPSSPTPTSDLEPRTSKPEGISDGFTMIPTEFISASTTERALTSTPIYDLEPRTQQPVNISDETTEILTELTSTRERDDPIISTPLYELELKTDKPIDIEEGITVISTEVISDQETEKPLSITTISDLRPVTSKDKNVSDALTGIPTKFISVQETEEYLTSTPLSDMEPRTIWPSYISDGLTIIPTEISPEETTETPLTQKPMPVIKPRTGKPVNISDDTTEIPTETDEPSLTTSYFDLQQKLDKTEDIIYDEIEFPKEFTPLIATEKLLTSTPISDLESKTDESIVTRESKTEIPTEFISILETEAYLKSSTISDLEARTDKPTDIRDDITEFPSGLTSVPEIDEPLTSTHKPITSKPEEISDTSTGITTKLPSVETTDKSLNYTFIYDEEIATSKPINESDDTTKIPTDFISTQETDESSFTSLYDLEIKTVKPGDISDVLTRASTEFTSTQETDDPLLSTPHSDFESRTDKPVNATPIDVKTEIATEVDSTTESMPMHPYYAKIPKTPLPIHLLTESTTTEFFISDTSTDKITTVIQKEKIDDKTEIATEIASFETTEKPLIYTLISDIEPTTDTTITISDNITIIPVESTSMQEIERPLKSTPISVLEPRTGKPVDISEDITEIPSEFTSAQETDEPQTFTSVSEFKSTTVKPVNISDDITVVPTEYTVIGGTETTLIPKPLSEIESITSKPKEISITVKDIEIEFSFETTTEKLLTSTPMDKIEPTTSKLVNISDDITAVPTEYTSISETDELLTSTPVSYQKPRTDIPEDISDDTTEIPTEFTFVPETDEHLTFTSLSDLQPTTIKPEDISESLTGLPTEFSSSETTKKPLTSTPLYEVKPITDKPVKIIDNLTELISIQETEEPISTPIYDLEQTGISTEFTFVEKTEEPLTLTPISDLESRTDKPFKISEDTTKITTEFTFIQETDGPLTITSLSDLQPITTKPEEISDQIVTEIPSKSTFVQEKDEPITLSSLFEMESSTHKSTDVDKDLFDRESLKTTEKEDIIFEKTTISLRDESELISVMEFEDDSQDNKTLETTDFRFSTTPYLLTRTIDSDEQTERTTVDFSKDAPTFYKDDEVTTDVPFETTTEELQDEKEILPSEKPMTLHPYATFAHRTLEIESLSTTKVVDEESSTTYQPPKMDDVRNETFSIEIDSTTLPQDLSPITKSFDEKLPTAYQPKINVTLNETFPVEIDLTTMAYDQSPSTKVSDKELSTTYQLPKIDGVMNETLPVEIDTTTKAFEDLPKTKVPDEEFSTTYLETKIGDVLNDTLPEEVDLTTIAYDTSPATKAPEDEFTTTYLAPEIDDTLNKTLDEIVDSTILAYDLPTTTTADIPEIDFQTTYIPPKVDDMNETLPVETEMTTKAYEHSPITKIPDKEFPTTYLAPKIDESLNETLPEIVDSTILAYDLSTATTTTTAEIPKVDFQTTYLPPKIDEMNETLPVEIDMTTKAYEHLPITKVPDKEFPTTYLPPKIDDALNDTLPAEVDLTTRAYDISPATKAPEDEFPTTYLSSKIDTLNETLPEIVDSTILTHDLTSTTPSKIPEIDFQTTYVPPKIDDILNETLLEEVDLATVDYDLPSTTKIPEKEFPTTYLPPKIDDVLNDTLPVEVDSTTIVSEVSAETSKEPETTETYISGIELEVTETRLPYIDDQMTTKSSVPVDFTTKIPPKEFDFENDTEASTISFTKLETKTSVDISDEVVYRNITTTPLTVDVTALEETTDVVDISTDELELSDDVTTVGEKLTEVVTDMLDEISSAEPTTVIPDKISSPFMNETELEIETTPLPKKPLTTPFKILEPRTGKPEDIDDYDIASELPTIAMDDEIVPDTTTPFDEKTETIITTESEVIDEMVADVREPPLVTTLMPKVIFTTRTEINATELSVDIDDERTTKYYREETESPTVTTDDYFELITTEKVPVTKDVITPDILVDKDIMDDLDILETATKSPEEDPDIFDKYLTTSKDREDITIVTETEKIKILPETTSSTPIDDTTTTDKEDPKKFIDSIVNETVTELEHDISPTERDIYKFTTLADEEIISFHPTLETETTFPEYESTEFSSNETTKISSLDKETSPPDISLGRVTTEISYLYEVPTEKTTLTYVSESTTPKLSDDSTLLAEEIKTSTASKPLVTETSIFSAEEKVETTTDSESPISEVTTSKADDLSTVGFEKHVTLPPFLLLPKSKLEPKEITTKKIEESLTTMISSTKFDDDETTDFVEETTEIAKPEYSTEVGENATAIDTVTTLQELEVTDEVTETGISHISVTTASITTLAADVTEITSAETEKYAFTTSEKLKTDALSDLLGNISTTPSLVDVGTYTVIPPEESTKVDDLITDIQDLIKDPTTESTKLSEIDAEFTTEKSKEGDAAFTTDKISSIFIDESASEIHTTPEPKKPLTIPFKIHEPRTEKPEDIYEYDIASELPTIAMEDELLPDTTTPIDEKTVTIIDDKAVDVTEPPVVTTLLPETIFTTIPETYITELSVDIKEERTTKVYLEETVSAMVTTDDYLELTTTEKIPVFKDSTPSSILVDKDVIDDSDILETATKSPVEDPDLFDEKITTSKISLATETEKTDLVFETTFFTPKDVSVTTDIVDLKELTEETVTEVLDDISSIDSETTRMDPEYTFMQRTLETKKLSTPEYIEEDLTSVSKPSEIESTFTDPPLEKTTTITTKDLFTETDFVVDTEPTTLSSFEFETKGFTEDFTDITVRENLTTTSIFVGEKVSTSKPEESIDFTTVVTDIPAIVEQTTHDIKNLTIAQIEITDEISTLPIDVTTDKTSAATTEISDISTIISEKGKTIIVTSPEEDITETTSATEPYLKTQNVTKSKDELTSELEKENKTSTLAPLPEERIKLTKMTTILPEIITEVEVPDPNKTTEHISEESTIHPKPDETEVPLPHFTFSTISTLSGEVTEVLDSDTTIVDDSIITASTDLVQDLDKTTTLSPSSFVKLSTFYLPPITTTEFPTVITSKQTDITQPTLQTDKTKEYVPSITDTFTTEFESTSSTSVPFIDETNITQTELFEFSTTSQKVIDEVSDEYSSILPSTETPIIFTTETFPDQHVPKIFLESPDDFEDKVFEPRVKDIPSHNVTLISEFDTSELDSTTIETVTDKEFEKEVLIETTLAPETEYTTIGEQDVSTAKDHTTPYEEETKIEPQVTPSTHIPIEEVETSDATTTQFVEMTDKPFDISTVSSTEADKEETIVTQPDTTDKPSEISTVSPTKTDEEKTISPQPEVITETHTEADVTELGVDTTTTPISETYSPETHTISSVDFTTGKYTTEPEDIALDTTDRITDETATGKIPEQTSIPDKETLTTTLEPHVEAEEPALTSTEFVSEILTERPLEETTTEYFAEETTLEPHVETEEPTKTSTEFVSEKLTERPLEETTTEYLLEETTLPKQETDVQDVTEVQEKEQYKKCSWNNKVYEHGTSVPPDSECQDFCKCENGTVKCKHRACEKVPPSFLRCAPVTSNDTCCPVYDCGEPVPTEAICEKDGKIFNNGDYVPSYTECLDCYCLDGEIVCASLECGVPRSGCTALVQRDSDCCPILYECDESPMEAEEFMIDLDEELVNATTAFIPDTDVTVVDDIATTISTKTPPVDISSTPLGTTKKPTMVVDDDDKITTVKLPSMEEETLLTTVDSISTIEEEDTTITPVEVDEEVLISEDKEDPSVTDPSLAITTADEKVTDKAPVSEITEIPETEISEEPEISTEKVTKPTEEVDLVSVPEKEIMTVQPEIDLVDESITLMVSEDLTTEFSTEPALVASSTVSATVPPELKEPVTDDKPDLTTVKEPEDELPKETIPEVSGESLVTESSTEPSLIVSSTVSAIVHPELKEPVTDDKLELTPVKEPEDEVPKETVPEEPFPPFPGFPPQEEDDHGQTYLPPFSDKESTTWKPTTTTELVIGPGNCLFDSKVYASAEQIPRDDPCDFCFCFRGDIICLQQTCPEPIYGCYEEAIPGFCCPRYECPVRQEFVNITTTTPSPFPGFPPSYKTSRIAMCEIEGRHYASGEVVKSASSPCHECICGSDGFMKCIPKECDTKRKIYKYGYR